MSQEKPYATSAQLDALVHQMYRAGMIFSEAVAELRFVARGSAEKTAGVWVDGQYVGYVKELNGEKKMLLLPGKHEIVVRQSWYRDYVEQAVLEPGEVHTIKLSLTKDGRTAPKSATGELKISATPVRAAVFVDEQFAGHADEFDGVGKAMLLRSSAKIELLLATVRRSKFRAFGTPAKSVLRIQIDPNHEQGGPE